MSQNPSFQPMKPLSIGNVVSAGLRIYRDRFRSYFRLAFIAYLWVFVPIYGWAKFASILGLISRLAFRELIENPESEREAQRYVNPRMWRFLGAGILVALIFFGAIFGMAIAYGIVAAIIGIIFSQNPSPVNIFISFLLGFLLIIAFLFGYVWLFSRLFLVEMPLAIEDNVTANSAIARSWELTKGSVLRIGGIVFVAFLISLPLSIIIQIATWIVQIVLLSIFPQDSPMFGFLLLLFILPLSIASGALLLPFWQAIKAVIYYDMRVRREGFGVQLGN